MTDEENHKKQEIDKEQHIQNVVNSTSRKKIIVSGPGTGKTSAFQDVLKTKSSNCLALTFIKTLAVDLQKDLGGLAECYTFHAYSKKLLHIIRVEGIRKDFHYYPELPDLIHADSVVIGNPVSEMRKAFRALNEDQNMRYYLERGNYYNGVGYDDAVYRVLKHFHVNPHSIPSYEQIVVDEYQDFVPLEVSFIDELAKNSHVLIAGDDDQAIYAFRDASPEYIRGKSRHPDYESFGLPYCSRSTEVVVNAVNDVVEKAQQGNNLVDRIPKKLVCYLPKKEQDNNLYPKIIHARCSTHTSRAPYISKFIKKIIDSIPQELIDDANDRGCPCVLIAGPSHYTKQIYEHLKPSFQNIDFTPRKNPTIDILDGYKILFNDEHSNLGWRIVVECEDLENKNDLIILSHKNKNYIEILPASFVEHHLEIIEIIKKINGGEQLTASEEKKVTEKCNKDIRVIQEFLNIDPDKEPSAEESNNGEISIKICTINRSKGLSANYVFLVGLNNGDLPKDQINPTDNEICQFIVGLSRTRKECYLISNQGFAGTFNLQKSVFIDWINPENIKYISVNKQYWSNST